MAGRSIITTCLEETQALAQQFAGLLTAGDVVCFYGDLGAGKTTFIKVLVSQMTDTPTSAVTSPTFNYCHSYENIHHFDLYRLESSQDFLHLGFDELMNPNSFCFIEWAERIEDILPTSVWKVHMEVLGTKKRKITYEKYSFSKRDIPSIGS